MGCDHSHVNGYCQDIADSVGNGFTSMSETQEKKFIALEAQLNAILTILNAKAVINSVEGRSNSEGNNDWNDCSASTWTGAIGRISGTVTGRLGAANSEFESRMASVQDLVDQILRKLGNA